MYPLNGTFWPLGMAKFFLARHEKWVVHPCAKQTNRIYLRCRSFTKNTKFPFITFTRRIHSSLLFNVFFSPSANCFGENMEVFIDSLYRLIFFQSLKILQFAFFKISHYISIPVLFCLSAFLKAHYWVDMDLKNLCMMKKNLLLYLSKSKF